MRNVRSTCVLVAVLLAGPAMAAPRAAGVAPSNAEIRRILAERLGAASKGCGIVVGIVEPRGRRVVAYGHVDARDPRPLTADTAFEIASVTKVLTALLLADMARRGEVSLDEPVSKLLPPGIRVPERHGRSITLSDLATHTSGLPFMTGDVGTDDGPATQAAAAEHTKRFLSRLELTRDIGTQWDYSNVGYWLLGKALAARSGMDFERLLRARVLGPLGLKSTAITITSALKKRMAVGHDAALGAARGWSSQAAYADMGAAGGLVSTVRDLQTLLAAAMGLEPTPLKASLDGMLATRRPMPGGEQGLGWILLGTGDDALVAHEGGSWGFASFVAWDRRSHTGVVVLANQVNGVADLGRHLLRPEVPLGHPTFAKRVEVALDAAALDAVAGRYEAEGEGVFTVAREGTVLTLQAPPDWGLPALRLRPEGPRAFFCAELPLRVTVGETADGRARGIVVTPPRGQRPIAATRVEDK